MNKAKVLVAKFVPDLHRMEPRNMGVIVWSPNGIEYKFLGRGKNGKVGECPDFVSPSDRKLYRQWVDYWTTMLDNEYMKDSSGVIIPRSSPDYVQSLLAKAKPGCSLVSVAELPIEEKVFNTQAAVIDMYNHLVKTAPTAVTAQKKRLAARCEEIFTEIGVSDDPSLQRKRKIPCMIHRIPRTFHADYTKEVGNKIIAALKLIPIHKDVNVNDALYMFEKLKAATKYKGTLRCAIVDSREWSENHKKAGENALPVIVKSTDITIDLAIADKARKQFEELGFSSRT